jgi:hypothetical protein
MAPDPHLLRLPSRARALASTVGSPQTTFFLFHKKRSGRIPSRLQKNALRVSAKGNKNTQQAGEQRQER